MAFHGMADRILRRPLGGKSFKISLRISAVFTAFMQVFSRVFAAHTLSCLPVSVYLLYFIYGLGCQLCLAHGTKLGAVSQQGGGSKDSRENVHERRENG